MNKKDTVCVVPYIALEVEKDGNLKPCCEYPSRPKFANFKDYARWWSTDLNQIKTDLHNGIGHKGCFRCKNNEELGGYSRRKMMNEKYPAKYAEIINAESPSDIKLSNTKFVHLNFGNSCNLKCVMCSPEFSSSIATEYKLNRNKYSTIEWTLFWDDLVKNYENKWYKTPEFLTFKNQLLNNEIEEIMLTGGEPMMVPESLELLESIENPENINLYITTNGSYLDDRWISIISKFKKVSITVSLEGVGKYNEYIRYESNWDLIEKNIKTFANIKSVNLTITTVIQHFSVYTFLDLLDFYLNLPGESKGGLIYTPITWPGILHINTVPEEQMNIFKNALTTILSTILSKHKLIRTNITYATLLSLQKYLQSYKFDPTLYSNYKQYIDVLDSIRGTNYNETFGITE